MPLKNSEKKMNTERGGQSDTFEVREKKNR